MLNNVYAYQFAQQFLSFDLTWFTILRCTSSEAFISAIHVCFSFLLLPENHLLQNPIENQWFASMKSDRYSSMWSCHFCFVQKQRLAPCSLKHRLAHRKCPDTLNRRAEPGRRIKPNPQLQGTGRTKARPNGNIRSDQREVTMRCQHT